MSENIWQGIDFNEFNFKSVYDYLTEQKAFLEQATSRELVMEIESIDAYLDNVDEYPLVGLNKLFIVAPKLGNFRRKILTVMERRNKGSFPVDVFCHVDELKDFDISENDFLSKISEILNRKKVQDSIISLYKQSKEIK